MSTTTRAGLGTYKEIMRTSLVSGNTLVSRMRTRNDDMRGYLPCGCGTNCVWSIRSCVIAGVLDLWCVQFGEWNWRDVFGRCEAKNACAVYILLLAVGWKSRYVLCHHVAGVLRMRWGWEESVLICLRAYWHVFGGRLRFARHPHDIKIYRQQRQHNTLKRFMNL